MVIHLLLPYMDLSLNQKKKMSFFNRVMAEELSNAAQTRAWTEPCGSWKALTQEHGRDSNCSLKIRSYTQTECESV